ncbi:MAG TPA: MotA/TolQ/ExbB proton channel family protein [Gammaproteobacteria bacterium]|nr:MotA/TolQ/ExbB proton channel family protein [Gammaproteobacteria bacterium]
MKDNPDYVQRRSFYVVVKDYEQETCFILMLWALAILVYKGHAVYLQQKLLERDLLGLPENMPVGIEDTRDLVSRLQSLPGLERESLLPRALLTAIERFAATHNVQDASTSARAVCDSEGERLESELSIIRYVAWAIPSVGFIGTVRGIGDALGQANRAVTGDITGVTESLGVAFNSTFIALVISIVLMFFVHQLQLMQERLVLDSERYTDQWVVRRLKL